MHEWQRMVQLIVEKMDESIQKRQDETLTLAQLAGWFGYSESHFSRKFREISGMSFRDYVRFRKLDDAGGSEADSSSGQIMGFLNDPAGRICSWGIPLAECYGVRLPAEYDGPVPEQMILTDICAGEYIVFEHGPFDFETENSAVEQQIETAMKAFDYTASGYQLDTSPGRIFYFYHDCERFWKYVRPVKKV